MYKEVHPRTWKNARKEISKDLHPSNGYKSVVAAAGVTAIEKQIPKKPHLWGDGYDTDGNLVFDMWNCPNCNETYEVEYDDYKYCPNCGQAIDWSDA